MKTAVLAKYSKGQILFTILLSVKDAAGQPIPKLSTGSVQVTAFGKDPFPSNPPTGQITKGTVVQVGAKKISLRPYFPMTMLLHEAFVFLPLSLNSRPWWFKVEVTSGSDSGEAFKYVV